jgi:hypothetical protein
MKKFNIENEIKFLKKMSSPFYSGAYPEGIIIGVDEKSEYISECYEYAKDLYDDLPSVEDIDIDEDNFKYYVDYVNNTCVVFAFLSTSSLINVIIYNSRESFDCGFLSKMYRDKIKPECSTGCIKNLFYTNDGIHPSNYILFSSVRLMIGA